MFYDVIFTVLDLLVIRGHNCIIDFLLKFKFSVSSELEFVQLCGSVNLMALALLGPHLSLILNVSTGFLFQ